MRIIAPDLITAKVAELVSDCNYFLPHDVVNALKEAAENEEDKKAKTILYKIIENHKTAKKGVYPLCQDTGIAVVFLEIGGEVKVDGDIYRAINRGVEQGYAASYLRKSVADPLTRLNTGTNAPAVIHTSLAKGPNIKISIMTKGAGSENKSALKMLAAGRGSGCHKGLRDGNRKKCRRIGLPALYSGSGRWRQHGNLRASGEKSSLKERK